MLLFRVSTLACFLLAAQVQAASPISLRTLPLHDTQGKTIEVGSAELTVFCFLGTECPLAKMYGPRLQKLADQFADRGVAFIGVNSNLHDSPSEVDAYALKHSLRFPIAKDDEQLVADALGARRTPEVFVLNRLGFILYQGRIDDQYEPGVARSHPTKNDLKDAIKTLLSGKTLTKPSTPSVGCLITRLPKHQDHKSRDAITFHRDVAPVLNRHCVECHRSGEIAPFALTDYEEVIGWAEMMVEVIEQQRMPPWHADPQVGHFLGQRQMPEEDKALISRWVDSGMPEGDPTERPDTPVWTSGWHLQTSPEAEFVMRDRPFSVPADGVVEYQYYVVDPGWAEDRWIRAAQVIPGNPEVVHHAIVFVRPPDGSEFNGIGWLGAYVPGQRTIALPDRHARHVPAGSKLVFQLHYTPNGTATEDTTRVGVWFADEKSLTHQVSTRVAINHEFEIPPHDPNYQVKLSSKRFPANGHLLGISPHMHFRGKSFVVRAVKTDQRMNQQRGTDQDDPSKMLLSIPQYDFNWQHWYAFAEPLSLRNIHSLEMTASFDNSRENPSNPDPTEYVSWGDQTWEEMAIAFFDVAHPIGSKMEHHDAESLSRILPSKEKIAARQRRIDRRVKQFIDKMDKNRDGVIKRQETPFAFRRYGFWEMDKNRDGVIDRSEVESRAERE